MYSSERNALSTINKTPFNCGGDRNLRDSYFNIWAHTITQLTAWLDTL